MLKQLNSVEAFYHEHENVRIFTNLDDIGEPYTCTQWGNFGGIATLVTDDGAGSSIWVNSTRVQRTQVLFLLITQ